MPPLCVPQDMDWHWGYKFFFGAVFVLHQLRVHLYFYFFHCKILKILPKKQLDDRSTKTGEIYYFRLITVLILPSIYFALLIEEKVPTPD
jgi:hypothetical protein